MGPIEGDARRTGGVIPIPVALDHEEVFPKLIRESFLVFWITREVGNVPYGCVSRLAEYHKVVVQYVDVGDNFGSNLIGIVKGFQGLPLIAYSGRWSPHLKIAVAHR